MSSVSVSPTFKVIAFVTIVKKEKKATKNSLSLFIMFP